MGTQQMLLILLALLIVGVAIAIGIGLFKDNSALHSRDAIQAEIAHLGARAQVYYRTPARSGGGGNSFNGLTGITQLMSNPAGPNATYSLTNNGSYLTIDAIGHDTGFDGVNPLKVVLIVSSDSTYFDATQGN